MEESHNFRKNPHTHTHTHTLYFLLIREWENINRVLVLYLFYICPQAIQVYPSGYNHKQRMYVVYVYTHYIYIFLGLLYFLGGLKGLL